MFRGALSPPLGQGFRVLGRIARSGGRAELQRSAGSQHAATPAAHELNPPKYLGKHPLDRRGYPRFWARAEGQLSKAAVAEPDDGIELQGRVSSWRGQVAARQLQVESRAILLALRSPEMPAERLDDVAAERKTQAGAGRLSGEECFEDLCNLPGRDADAVVADVEQHVLAAERRRADRNAAMSAPRRAQGLDRVSEQVDENPLNLDSIGQDRRQI